jgi:hypothetical protein
LPVWRGARNVFRLVWQRSWNGERPLQELSHGDLINRSREGGVRGKRAVVLDEFLTFGQRAAEVLSIAAQVVKAWLAVVQVLFHDVRSFTTRVYDLHIQSVHTLLDTSAHPSHVSEREAGPLSSPNGNNDSDGTADARGAAKRLISDRSLHLMYLH